MTEDRVAAAELWAQVAPPQAGALEGLRVVDFGQYLAGPLCAMLLADQGASVIRVDPPGGPRWDSPVNAVLLRGRRQICLDLKDAADRRRARALVASADVVIENFRPGVADRLGVGAVAMTAAAPRLVYCSLPGFGSDDRRSGDAAWEGVVMAAASAYSLAVSASVIPGGPGAGAAPVFSPLPLASVFGAAEGAMAIIAAVVARDRDGVGQRIEVPLFDSLFEAIGLRALSYDRDAPPFTDFGSGFYHCSEDSYFTFIASWFHHLERFVTAAGVGHWIEDGIVDYDRLWADPAVLVELQQRLAALFATQPAREWETLARANGCTVGMLRSLSDWIAEPHAVESGTLIDVDDPVLGRVRVPGAAVHLHGHANDVAAPRRPAGADTTTIVAAIDRLVAATPADEHPAGRDESSRPAPLAGLRVLDLSRVVAAPTAAKLLGQLGAEVVKVDDDPRLSRAAFRMPAMHETLNRGKQTIVLNLKDSEDADVFRRLLAQSDVLVHNFSLSVEPRLGIDEAAVRNVAPDIVYLYLNTYGRRGPWAEHRGFAELANITTGVTERSMGDARPPTAASASMDYPRWTFTDYSAGVLGAFGALVALYSQARLGKAHLVETSLARATALEQILALVATGGVPLAVPRGTAATGWGPLQRLYATSDGTVFVGASPDQLGALLAALGIKGEVMGDHTDAAASEAAIEAALASSSTAEACRLLQSAGAGVARVSSTAELMAPGGVAEQRGLRLDDPSPKFGRVVMPGPVVRFSSTPMRAGFLPGDFGADRPAILEQLDSA